MRIELIAHIDLPTDATREQIKEWFEYEIGKRCGEMELDVKTVNYI